ncbi:MAG: PetM family of cytochrome b6f complex subunit 7, partial [Actinomycetospora chiangmaiensis]|nr:PetM family of cytochrome b6f complex subunit 7 [Actinomycetospora chiangmaiensis]
MFRFLARVLGFLLMAGGFVALVYDGARSIA